MAKLKDGFYKLTAEAVGSDSYMLLAGGGSKALSDFATASGVVTALGTNGNYVTWTKNGTANNLTVPYATNADTVDNKHASDFIQTSVQMISGKGGTLNGYHQENGWHRIATIDTSASHGYGSHILYLTGTYNYAQNTNAIIHINTMYTTGKITQVSGYVGFANKIRLVNVSMNKFYVDIHINYTDNTSFSFDTPGTVYYYFLGNGSVTINTLVEKITDTVTAASEVTLVDTEGNVLTSGNYTNWINTTNFPGLNSVGDITGVTAGAGLSGGGTSGSVTLTNAGVRSATINGNYLRVNTNGTNADLTIPYATTASLLNNTSVSDPSTAASGQNVKWYSQIRNSSGYAGTNYGFPVSNHANGILWLGTHSGPFGWLMGFSSNGHIYARYISNNSFPTTANGGSWNKIVWAYEAFPINAYNYTSGCLVKLNISSNSNSMISVHITGNAFRTSAASKVINSIVEFYNYQDGNDILNYNATHFGYNFGDINIFNYDNKVCLWFKQKYNYMSFSVFANHTSSGSANNKVLSISNSAMPTSGVTRSKTITPNTIAYSSDLTWSSISSKPSFATVATSGSYNDLSNKPTIPTSLPANGGNADTVDGYHATMNNNKPWGTIPAITTGGWMDVGRHFEFHYDNTTGSDYSTLLTCTGNHSNVVNLPSASGTLALTSQIPTVTNYYWANVKISSSSNEATTPTFSTIATTGVSYVATLRPSTTNQHYLGSADNRWNGVFSKAGNFSGLITLSVATGTSPFKITSTTVNTNLNADMVDGKHASDFAEASHSHSYLPLAGGTMTGNIVAHVGDTQRGIKFGSGYLNSLSNQLLWQSDEAIRFGSSSWDWDAWAGLKYKHSSKIIYLGLADGTIFKANTALSGGKLYLPGISDAYTGNGTYKILHAGNSSVSGGGSSWGSSITVKINGTTKTLTIPSNPNTWRGITDSYSGTDSTISLSQKGGNALYNALVNGYAASAGNAETVDNYHIWVGTSGLLPGTKVNNTIYIII